MSLLNIQPTHVRPMMEFGIAMLINAMNTVQAQAVSQVATEELMVPFGLSGSTAVDMWRMSKIFAVQSLLLVISRLLLMGFT